MNASILVEEAVHAHLVAVASLKAPALASPLAALGRIEITKSQHTNIADQLFTEIINQQLSIRASDSIWSRVRQAASSLGGDVRQLFIEEHEALLRTCGVSRQKAKALRAVHEAEKAGVLNDGELTVLSHEERAARLTSIWGVGRWTADMLGIFYFLDPDIWPAGDVAVVGTLRRITGADDTHVLASEFAPHRSILARYLWRIRDSI